MEPIYLTLLILCIAVAVLSFFVGKLMKELDRIEDKIFSPWPEPKDNELRARLRDAGIIKTETIGGAAMFGTCDEVYGKKKMTAVESLSEIESKILKRTKKNFDELSEDVTRIGDNFYAFTTTLGYQLKTTEAQPSKTEWVKTPQPKPAAKK